MKDATVFFFGFFDRFWFLVLSVYLMASPVGGSEWATCKSHQTTPVNNRPVARVAIGLYGLYRHECPAANFEAVFAKALAKSSKYTYVVDVFLHANIADTDQGVRNFIRGTSVPKHISISSLTWAKFKPCEFSAENQNFIDIEVEEILKKTCHKHGDHWSGNLTSANGCDTTKNYFRALYSMRYVSRMISGHEQRVFTPYDVVVVVRPDVLFTRQMNVSIFDDIVDQGRSTPLKKELVYLPKWGHADGYNDRFMVGHRKPVLHAMQRLSGMVDYVESQQKPVHSESYVKHVVDAYVTRRNKQSGVHSEVKQAQSFYMRRVRANGALVNPQYFDPQYYAPSEGERQHVDAQFIYCDAAKAVETFGDGLSEPNYDVKWRSFKHVFKGRRYAQPSEKHLKF